MSGDEELHYLSLAEVSARMRRREVSPVEVLEHELERIRRLDGVLHSLTAVAEEESLAAAREAERAFAAGAARGPLQGVPVTFKDVMDVKGMPTTGNSRVYQDRQPTADAAVAARLRAAGAILLGKANLNELGWSIPSDADLFPPVRNPWSPERQAIGSSSGSGAATAAGFCYASLGTDGGGSARLPAGQMGLVGLKPTRGRVPKAGLIGSGSVSEISVLARTAEDARLVFAAIADAAPERVRTALNGRLDALTLGVPRAYIDAIEVDPEVLASFEAGLAVLRGLGVTIREIALPDFAYARDANFVMINVESFSRNEATLRATPELLGRATRRYLTMGAFASGADYVRAQRVAAHFQRLLDERFREVDGIVTPTSPVITAEAARAPSSHRRGINASFTSPFNLTGLPGISIPAGISQLGIPIGLQAAGPAGSEGLLLDIAEAFGRETGSAALHPDEAALVAAATA